MADGRREPVRVGLLGAGAVAQAVHLPAYRQLTRRDRARLVALCETEASKRRALAERTGVDHAVASIDELLAIDEVEAVDVCLPSHLHRDAVVRCLEAGKHVLCEKPLGLSVADVVAIAEAAEASRRQLVVGMNNRYRDDSILLKSFIDDGTLGEVLHARASWFKPRGRVRADDWHVQRERSGGGVFIDLGISILDLVLWLCDYPPVDRIRASFLTRTPGIDVEDSAFVTLACADGTSVALETSWDVVGTTETISVSLFGSEASGFLPPIRILTRRHGETLNLAPQSQRRAGRLFLESYEREIAFFAEVVAGREEAPPIAEQVALARVVEAIERSAAESREVAVAAADDRG